jgi:DNA polymerase-3 subunit beta
MKVTVERSELLKSLGHVHRVVERRNTIPILANVLLQADRSKLALKATDLDVEVTDTIAAEVGPGGSTTVPAHMFFDIVRKLPEGAQIILESSGDRAALTIRAGRSRFTLQTLPESDFPDLAPGEMTHKFTLKAADLKRLIDKTQFAISTEETSTASICTPRVPPRRRRCARLRPTAIGWRRWSSNCPKAPPACRVSSCRAKPSAKCSA